MKPALLVAAAFSWAAANAPAAEPPASKCDSAQARQFDFWVGDWDLTFQDEGKTATSHNRISKILDGCALLEEFSGPPGTPLQGRSLSTYDRLTHRWKQTWVDNDATYLDFSGGFADGRMILSREAQKDGKRFLQRMVWQGIRADAFEWLWQRSDDDGRTWTTAWKIDYRRSARQGT